MVKADVEPKVLEAQEKLFLIIKKAGSLGIEPVHLARLATSRKLNHTYKFRNTRIYLISAVVPLILISYGFGLQQSAYNIYQDWMEGTPNPRQVGYSHGKV